MRKSLTFEMPDEIYAALEQIAAQSGRSTSELALEWLARYTARSRPSLSAEELAAAWARLRRHAGAANSGNSRSADNEHLDADLAREYANT